MTTQNPLAQLSPLLVGGPTLRFDYAGMRVLTDPTFDVPRSYEGGGVTLVKLIGPSVALDEIGPIDIVLLSHDQHPDNLDIAGRGMLADVPTVLSTPDAASRIDGVSGLDPWQATVIASRTNASVRVTAVPAVHGPEGAEAITGAVTGFVLEADGWPTVYFSGDNASVDAVRTIAERFPQIDVAVLCAGAADVGRFNGVAVTLTAAAAVQTAMLLASSTIIPVHEEGWAHFTESVSDLRSAADRAGLTSRFAFLEPGTVGSERP